MPLASERFTIIASKMIIFSLKKAGLLLIAGLIDEAPIKTYSFRDMLGDSCMRHKAR